MAVVFIGLVLSQPTYATETDSQTVASGHADAKISVSENQAKFDVDYIENGVRVIIPKVLPKTNLKEGQSVLWATYYGKELSQQMQAAYKDAGYSVKMGSIFNSGEYYHQFLVFTGNKELFFKLNEYGAQAGSNHTWFMRGVAAVYGAAAAVAGTKLGGLNSGAFAGGTAMANVDTKTREYVSSFAIFDGYDTIEAKETDIIQVFAVTVGVNSAQKKGRVVFVSENGVFDSDLITRVLMKAQNFTKN